MKKNRKGRPRKSAADRRGPKIQVRVTKKEKAAIQREAKATGMTVSDWIRTQINVLQKRP